MKNTIKTFSIFANKSEKSQEVAEIFRKLNKESASPLTETKNGELIIAIGGDGTFIDSVTSTNFDKTKIYVGIHTGTLGFLQNICPDDISHLINVLNTQKNLSTRKVAVSDITVTLTNNTQKHYFSLNEVLIVGKDRKKITFSEIVHNEFFQNINGNGIIIATSTGQTAYSMNLGGAIDFSNNYQLICTPEIPIKNAAYERFIPNSIVCSKIDIILKPSEVIQIIIDGIVKDIDSKLIEKVSVSIHQNSNFINKLEFEKFSKTKIIREKILGYDE